MATSRGLERRQRAEGAQTTEGAVVAGARRPTAADLAGDLVLPLGRLVSLAETLCEPPRVGCMTSASAMLGGLVVPWAQ